MIGQHCKASCAHTCTSQMKCKRSDMMWLIEACSVSYSSALLSALLLLAIEGLLVYTSTHYCGIVKSLHGCCSVATERQ
eukprot:6434-Heterococcus_DN1.PRE.2